MRYVLAVVGVVLVIGALAFIKYSQIAMLIGMGKEMEASGPPPETVGTHKAEMQSWEGTLSAVGTLQSIKGVSVSNEPPGTITKILFESGKIVQEGDVLVELDTSVERAQLVSAQVRLELAHRNALRSRALVASGVTTQAQLDADEAALRSAAADIAVLNATINRKIVRAPFAGKLGIRAVNVGQYLNPGTPITSLEAIDAVYVDFPLPQQAQVAVGMKVRVQVTLGVQSEDEKPVGVAPAATSAPRPSSSAAPPASAAPPPSDGNGSAPEAASLSAEGVIDAVDPRVDPVTRTIRLRATVPNKDGKLKPGMFAEVQIVLPERPSVVTVPATAVMRASFGDSVFIVEEKVPENGGEKALFARQAFVRIGESRGDFISILEGVKAGEEVVSAGAFKLRNGGKVVVDNTVETKPQLSPRPENR